MAWALSSGIDVSHHQGYYLDKAKTRWATNITDYAQARAAVDWAQIKITDGTGFTDPGAVTHHRGFAGIPRGAYFFARPALPARDQVAYFLTRKAAIGVWERPDMLDVEVAGTSSAFLRELISEYRRQSGRQLVLVYTPIDPATWWDPNCRIWRARYRRTGQPSPDRWAAYLGLAQDHPGLAVLQWDDQWPLPGGGLVDINSQRLALDDLQEDDVPLSSEKVKIAAGTPGYESGPEIWASVAVADTLAVVHRMEVQIAGQQAAINHLAAALAEGDEVTADELRAVVREEMTRVVQVQVSVVDGDPHASGPSV